MCLLFQKPADVTFNDAQLTDMYRSNPDGFGIMYSEGNQLAIDKGIGSVANWITFFRKYEKQAACFHLRMRTHGDIDLENCHPYPVYGFDDAEYTVPLALMHNGILSHGNAADKSKSDTWHYIRHTLHVLLAKDPDLIFSDVLGSMISRDIGHNNKFAIMDHTGRTQIINRGSGVTWGGVWFSNTYAWSSRDNTLYPGINPPRPVLPAQAHLPYFPQGQYERNAAYYNSMDGEFHARFGAKQFDQLGNLKVDDAKPMLPGLPPISLLRKTVKQTRAVKLRIQREQKQADFNQDCDAILSILQVEASDAAKQIMLPMVERMVETFGGLATILLVEDVCATADTNKIDAELIELFKDHNKARSFMKAQQAVMVQ